MASSDAPALGASRLGIWQASCRVLAAVCGVLFYMPGPTRVALSLSAVHIFPVADSENDYLRFPHLVDDAMLTLAQAECALRL